MERLMFGHGFVPRIDRQNHRALDRALGPPSLFEDGTTDLSAVIMDGAWLQPDSDLVRQLSQADVHVIADTQGWRLGDERTFAVEKFRRLDHLPTSPLTMRDRDALARFIDDDLRWQKKLGATALMLPGVMPQKGSSDGIAALELAVDVALGSVDGSPVIGFLGIHSQDLGEVKSLASNGALSLLSALYVQVSPVNPMKDSVSKLVDVVEAMVVLSEIGIPVVGGHLGGLGGVLRSMGVAAADAGLGMGETFDARRLLRGPSTREEGSTGGPTGSRRYLPQIMRSVDRKQWDSLMSVDTLRGLLDCRLRCCRFRSLQDRGDWAREHSLRARIGEAVDLSSLPMSMRTSRQMDLLKASRASLVTVNSALGGAGQPPLPSEHIENQISALERLVARGPAA